MLKLVTLLHITCIVAIAAAIWPPAALADGAWSSVTTLAPRWNYAVAAVGTRALVIGGDRWDDATHGIVYSDQVDIYDASTGAWTSAKLSEPRNNVRTATTGTRVFVVGGERAGTPLDTVDVYDSANDSWSVTRMPDAISLPSVVAVGDQIVVVGTNKTDPTGVADVYDPAADTWTKTPLVGRTVNTIGLVVGDVALFGGDALRWESDGDAGTWDVVNVYDSAAHQWSSTRLSQTRSMPGLAVAGTRAFFAGGVAGGGVTDTIDIFDAASRSWTTAHLAQARARPLGVVANGQVLFAGGDLGQNASALPLTAVDILDLATGTWSVAQLSARRYVLKAATPGTHVLFAGWPTYDGGSPSVDVYDTVTRSWSVATLPDARERFAAVTVGQQALFAGGSYPGKMSRSARQNSDTVDIYDEPSGTWTSSKLHLAREPRDVAVIGSQALLVGGVLGCETCAEPRLDPVVDLYAAP